jgi:hypothetical protein
MKAKTAGKGKVVSRRYPALPTTVQSAGGTLTVQLVAEIKPDEPGEDILGHFDPSTRHILIKKSLRGDQQWLVYFHEITHAAIWDLDEEAVLRAEKAIVSALHKAGLLTEDD